MNKSTLEMLTLAALGGSGGGSSVDYPVEAVPITDNTTTMTQVKALIHNINAAGRHVFFDVASINNNQMYLTTIWLDDDTNPTQYRILDAVTGKMKAGRFNGSDLLKDLLDKAISDFVELTFTLIDAQQTQPTGLTMTLTDKNDNLYATDTYNGSPITFLVPRGFEYKLSYPAWDGHKISPPYSVSGYASADRAYTCNYMIGSYIYAFHIDSNESDPEDAVTYLEDAVGLTPAHMDYENEVFDYGSWENAFFMPKPCMVKYDGTVDYYLNKNNYAYRADGVTASDVANTEYEGNAMMEWGQNGKKIWYKIVPDDGDPTSATIYVSDSQSDSDFVCWSFYNSDGDVVDHFYTAIYNGTKVSGSNRMRSLSGMVESTYCDSSNSGVTEAELNNVGTDRIWYAEVYCDVTLINILLILMGKSLDSPTTFGYGNGTSRVKLTTGTGDALGMFYGYSTTTSVVKVFGMENWWGNAWRLFVGYLNDNGTLKYKLTRTTADGSTASDYNFDGTGFLTANAAPDHSGSWAFAKKMKFAGNQFSVIEVGASRTTYWCAPCYFTNNSITHARHGGSQGDNTSSAFTVSAEHVDWPPYCVLSMKPKLVQP